MHEIPIVERAFQLAAEHATFRELHAAMKREGYSGTSLDSYLSGRGIRQQLKSRYKSDETPGTER